MGINFQKTFGERNNAANDATQRELPKTQFWLNIGYMAEAVGDEEAKFVSLPMGIPLDTMDKRKLTSTNVDFRNFEAARNDLLDQMLEVAAKLEPGDDYIIDADGGLAIQIRRVNSEVAAPAVDETNRYARPKLFAVG